MVILDYQSLLFHLVLINTGIITMYVSAFILFYLHRYRECKNVFYQLVVNRSWKVYLLVVVLSL